MTGVILCVLHTWRTTQRKERYTFHYQILSKYTNTVTYRVYKEDLEILNFCPQIFRPGKAINETISEMFVLDVISYFSELTLEAT